MTHDEPVTPDSVLARGLDVTTRLAEEVAELSAISAGGLLVEMAIGRFVLNRDARHAWHLIDGHRTVRDIAAALALREDVDGDDLEDAVLGLCRQFVELGLTAPAASPAGLLTPGSVAEVV